MRIIPCHQEVCGIIRGGINHAVSEGKSFKYKTKIIGKTEV